MYTNVVHLYNPPAQVRHQHWLASYNVGPTGLLHQSAKGLKCTKLFCSLMLLHVLILYS